MKPRKHRSDERQLPLVFHVRAGGNSKAANDVEFITVSRKRRQPFRGTFELARMAAEVQDEDRQRLLEPTSLPKELRGWSPRPRPKTAIIALAAQRLIAKRSS
jgi:hypothetical protein